MSIETTATEQAIKDIYEVLAINAEAVLTATEKAIQDVMAILKGTK